MCLGMGRGGSGGLCSPCRRYYGNQLFLPSPSVLHKIISVFALQTRCFLFLSSNTKKYPLFRTSLMPPFFLPSDWQLGRPRQQKQNEKQVQKEMQGGVLRCLRVVAEEKEGQTGRRFIILSLLFFPKPASVFVAAPQEILGENRTERRCGIGAERRAGTVGGLTGKKQNYKEFKLQMRPYVRQVGEGGRALTIGYYPLRGKAQICRLLCEYLHVPYVDHFFTPDQWNWFRESEAADWVVRDLPFLRDEDFVVTGPAAMISYVVERAGRTDLCGRTLADRVRIDSIKSRHDLSGAVLGLIVSSRPSLSPQEKKSLSFYWAGKIVPILSDYEAECPVEGWYYGYLTLMDFVVYELLNLLESVFWEEVGKFSRLKALRARFASIPEIRNYENSSRALSEHSPVSYFSRFREEKMRSTHRPNLVLKEAALMDLND